MSAPFAPFARLDVDITSSDDREPAVLAPRLWKLVARGQQNDPILFKGLTGALVRLDVLADAQLRVTPLTARELTNAVSKVARLLVFTKDGHIVKSVARETIDMMLSMPPEEVPLPLLRAIAHAPVIGLDGSIRTTSGYHASRELYIHWDATLPPVPKSPAQKDIAKALGIINTPLQDFPFVDDASKATAVAIMLLPFVRSFIDGPTPLHLIAKSTAGTGASLLTDVLLTPGIGHRVGKMSAPASDGEWSYSLTSVLRELPQAVVIDNVRKLESHELAKILTDNYYTSRIVQSSQAVTLPVRCTWVATGNNPTLHQELQRRVVMCRLDAKSATPWTGRTFALKNLEVWLKEHRASLTWACLVLVKAWLVAGRPAFRQRHGLGSYERYVEVMGGLLDVAGVPAFLAPTTQAAVTLDVQTEAERWFVGEWFHQHGVAPVGTTDLLQLEGLSESVLAEYLKTVDAATLGSFIRELREKTFDLGDEGRLTVKRLANHHTTRRAQYQLTPLTEQNR